MDIRIIQNQTEVECRPLDDVNILFLNREKIQTNIGTSFVPFSRIFYYVFHTDTNIREELLPDIVKYEVAEMSFAEKNCPYVYFFTVDFDQYPTGVFRLMKYHLGDETCLEIFRFEDSLREYAIKKRIKLFFLSQDYCIMQKELLTELSDGYSGFFSFESQLIDLNSKAVYPIKEERFLRWGITKLFPIVNNVCAMKLGCSKLEDQQYKHFSAETIPKEAVIICSISQLISDLIIGNKKCNCELVDQTTSNETIAKVDKQGRYLIFSKYNLNDFSSKMIFYQFVSKEPTVVLCKPPTEESKTNCGFILDQRPFVARYTSKHLELLDVKSSEVVMRFSLNASIVDVKQDYVLLKTGKQMLFSSKNSFEIYQYPDFKLVSKLKSDDVTWLSLARNNLTIISYDKE